MSPFSSVLEDIEWLWNEWWLGQPDALTKGHLRRGSSTLRLLLVEGLLGKAWRYYGFERQPCILAPDLVALAARFGHRLDLAPGVIAGGGRQNGVDFSFVGAFRIDNPSTGVRACEDAGFAVCTTSIARVASEAPGPSSLDDLIEKRWHVSEYLESAGAVRRGTIIKRREVIEYFRNYVGGVHHDLLKGTARPKKDRYELTAELEKCVRVDVRDGLYFELLSIGQAVVRAADVQALAERIRADS